MSDQAEDDQTLRNRSTIRQEDNMSGGKSNVRADAAAQRERLTAAHADRVAALRKRID
jgi:hypothetical protein